VEGAEPIAAADNTAPDTTRRGRPTFRSDAGRVVYGGGGVSPDVMVPADTLTTAEQAYLRAISPQSQLEYATRYQLAIDLKDQVRSPDYTFRPEWREMFWQRLQKAGVNVERATFDAAGPVVDRVLDDRIAMVAFGDAGRFQRQRPVDNQLTRALDLLRKGRTTQELLALADEAAGRPGPSGRN
jgi:carboxyl-terminal processing protease